MEAQGFAGKFIKSCYKIYSKLLRKVKAPEAMISALRMQITESATVAHGFSVDEKYRGSPGMKDHDSNKPAVQRQAQCQVLIFWRSIFDSVQELVISSSVSATKRGAESTSYYLVKLIGVSALSNTILRPKSVGELVTKITTKELSDICSRGTSGRARRKSFGQKNLPAKTNRRSRRLSVFGRESFDDELTSSEEDKEDEEIDDDEECVVFKKSLRMQGRPQTDQDNEAEDIRSTTPGNSIEKMGTVP